MKIEKVDFAIITILPEEYEAIYKRFTPTPYTDPSTRHTYGISYLETKEGKGCTVAIARTSRSGNDASQQLAHWMINDLDPQMLLVVGIGGGVPDTDFTLGDVIISSYIHNFDVNAIKGKETTYDVTGGIHPAISNIVANLYLYQSQLADWNTEASIGMSRPVLLLTEKRLRGLIDSDVDEPWREKVEKALMWHFDRKQHGARAPKFLTGTIASSNTLVRSDAVLAQWLQDARSIRAVEMEVAGIYQAAQHISQQYPVMAIRGISDIIGFKRGDLWKLYACHTAAAFAYSFIAAGISELREQTLSSSGRTPPANPNLLPIQSPNASREHAPTLVASTAKSRPNIPNFQAGKEIIGTVLPLTEELRQEVPADTVACLKFATFPPEEVLIIVSSPEAQNWLPEEFHICLFQGEEIYHGRTLLRCQIQPLQATVTGVERPLSYLKQERQNQGLTVKDVANRLHVSPDTVLRWEKGKATPASYFIKKICGLYGKSAEELGLPVYDTGRDGGRSDCYSDCH